MRRDVDVSKDIPIFSRFFPKMRNIPHLSYRIRRDIFLIFFVNIGLSSSFVAPDIPYPPIHYLSSPTIRHPASKYIVVSFLHNKKRQRSRKGLLYVVCSRWFESNI